MTGEEDVDAVPAIRGPLAAVIPDRSSVVSLAP
jgi:hypothetical protein